MPQISEGFGGLRDAFGYLPIHRLFSKSGYIKNMASGSIRYFKRPTKKRKRVGITAIGRANQFHC